MFRHLRNSLRLIRIVRTLGRHDALFPGVIGETSPAVAFLLRLVSRRGVPGRPGQRIAAALAELGPTFIKLGQMLSTRSDLVGEQIAADLAELQDKLPPFPAEQARRTVESELGRPIADLYTVFEDTPVAAASIAQVHFAVTADGRDVAVKILRPDIEHRFRKDLDLFYWLARLVVRRLPRVRRLRPVEVVDLLASTTALEMDLRMEAAAAGELRENFQGDPTFVVPEVDWDRTSQRVLTIERVIGIPADERERIVAAGIDPNEVLAKAAAAFFRQVFEHGFFHADLHPGNIFVRFDGNISPVDFGIMGRLDRETRQHLADMMVAFLNRNYRRAAEVHFEAGWVPADQNHELFAQACRAIGEPVMGKPLREISIARLLGQLFAVTEQFRMETQLQLLLLQKSMLTVEGVGLTLNPRLNMWELSAPLIESWFMENRGPEARVVQAASDGLRALVRLPDVLREVEAAALTVSSGTLRIAPESIGLMVETHNRRARQRLIPLWIVTLATAAGVVYALLTG